MAHRDLRQGSLADALVSPKVGSSARLKGIAAVPDWSGFAALLAAGADVAILHP